MSDQEAKTGGLDILNAGSGHTEIRFNEKDTIELERAKRIITDMLRRGYVLFVESADGSLSRVQSFDSSKGTYIIADLGEPASAPERTLPALEAPAPAPEITDTLNVKRGRVRLKKEVPMARSKATAIGRTAGG